MVAEENGVRSCFDGTQVCTHGQWGPCGATIGTGTQSISGLNVGGYLTGSAPASTPPTPQGWTTPKSLSQPSSDGGPCASNPCDPYCVGFNEVPDAAIMLDAGVGGASSWSSLDPLAGVPGGFVNKGISDPCTKSSDCNFDTYCSAAGHCVFYKPGEKNAACNGVDLTAGAPCNNGTYPICNRGKTDLTVAMAVGGKIDVYKKNGGGNQFGSVCITAVGDPTCQLTLPAGGIKAGTCVSVNTCGNSGNVTVFVNPPQTANGNNPRVTECALGAEQGCVNNWSDIKSPGACVAQGVTTYLPKTVVQTYTATCPSGSTPQWMWLAYSGANTTSPSGGGSSSFSFSARLASLADGGYGSSVTLATSPNDPAVCAMTAGDAGGCPKNLFTLLGGLPAAQVSTLELTITLSPSADGLAASTLSSWQVTYSCPPSQ